MIEYAIDILTMIAGVALAFLAITAPVFVVFFIFDMVRLVRCYRNRNTAYWGMPMSKWIWGKLDMNYRINTRKK